MKRSENKIPITILICDDDEGDRMVTRRALHDARVSNALRFVEDGEQLLDYLYQRRAFSGETGSGSASGVDPVGPAQSQGETGASRPRS